MPQIQIIVFGGQPPKLTKGERAARAYLEAIPVEKFGEEMKRLLDMLETADPQSELFKALAHFAWMNEHHNEHHEREERLEMQLEEADRYVKQQTHEIGQLQARLNIASETIARLRTAMGNMREGG